VTSSEQAELIVFIVLAPLAVVTALGMVLTRNAVYSALLLVVNFFCLAGFYVLLEAQFVAAVQVIVYAGAIMVLFLFVLMLLGVDVAEDMRVEPLAGQRVTAVVLGLALAGLVLAGLFVSGPGDDRGNIALTGQESVVAPIDEDEPDIVQLGRDLFTRNILAFEVTAVLLTIAVVGAVVLVRNRGGQDLGVDDPGTAAH
jgi:NADH-quinone oxidoreductase subunit J